MPTLEVNSIGQLKRAVKKANAINKEWYDVRSILGNDWAMFYILIGAR